MERLSKLCRYKWNIVTIIQLLYGIVFTEIAKVIKLLNDQGYINNALSLIWIIIYIMCITVLLFRVMRGFGQSLLEINYYDRADTGDDCETFIDMSNKVRFSDFDDDLQTFILNNYSFCRNSLTHEFYLVPLKDIKSKILRVDNSIDVSDKENYLEKSLYTYIDCSDTDNIKEFCMRNPQVLSFVAVIGAKPQKVELTEEQSDLTEELLSKVLPDVHYADELNVQTKNEETDVVNGEDKSSED